MDECAKIPVDDVQAGAFIEGSEDALTRARQRIAQGGRVGMKLVAGSSRRARRGPALHCEFAWYVPRPDGNFEATPLPMAPGHLSELLKQLPEEERPAYLLACGLRGSEALPERNALLMLVREGRCFSADGERRPYQELAVSDVLAWSDLGAGRQALEVRLPPGASWLDESLGLLVEGDAGAVMDLPVWRERLEALARSVGEIDDKSVAAINAARESVRPRVRLPFARHYGLAFGTAGCGYALRLSRPARGKDGYDAVELVGLDAQGRPVRLTDLAQFCGKDWRLQAGSWRDGSGEGDPLVDRVDKALGELAVLPTRDLGIWSKRSRMSDLELIEVQVLAQHALGAHVKVFDDGFTETSPCPRVGTASASGPPRLRASIQAAPSAVRVSVVRLWVEWDGREFSPRTILDNRGVTPILRANDLRLPGEPPGADMVLRCLDRRTWIRVDRAQWEPMIDQLALLEQIPALLEKPVVMSDAQLAALLDEGIVLPQDAGKAQYAAAAAIAHCLAAKTQDSPLEIEGMVHPLKSIQAPAVSWLNALRTQGFGGLLADDRGFGKTVQAIAAIVEHRREARQAGRKAPPVLVLMEAKELSHWVRHFQAFSPELVVYQHHGPERIYSPTHLALNDVIITTYDVYKRRPDLFLGLGPELVFLDEATALKNHETERYKTVLRLRATAILVPMTGTPIGRKIADLWALMEVAVPGLLGSRHAFLRGAHDRGIAALEGPEQAQENVFVEQLRKRLAPFLMRRLKADHPEHFPARVPITQLVTLEAADVSAYESTRAQALALFDERIRRSGPGGAVLPGLRDVDILRRMASAPWRNNAVTTKGSYLRDLVRELVDGGHRTLVFTHDTAQMPGLEELLTSAGASVAAYRGEPHRREEALAAFKAGLADVLVLSKMGASGLDLPEADTVIINDPWLDPSVMDQMLDRAHRISSKTAQVTFYLLVAASTAEEVGVKMLGRMRESSAAVIDGGSARLASLTASDVREMLEISPA